MSRIIKVFLPLIIILNLISCNENYPKTVSHIDGFWSTNSRYEIEINNFNEFPEEIQSFTEQYLIEKIGKPNFYKSDFSYGYIASNKPIYNESKMNKIVTLLHGEDSKENKDLDSKYNYPVYSIGFIYSDLSMGIEKYDLTFMVDNNGKILKDIAFPKVDLKSNNRNLIPIDSIHKILSDRKISSRKLELDLRFDRKNKTTFYYARTLIRSGSIIGPSCFPEYQEHFKVNALTGEIIEYNTDNRIEYYNN